MTEGLLQRTWVRVLLTVLTAAMMALIFFFSMENAERSDATSGQIAGKVINVVYPQYESYSSERKNVIYSDVQHIVRKAAHFSEYLILGVLLRLCLESWIGQRKWLHAAAWAGGTLYACTDEMHQLITDGRSGQWSDVLLDSCGVLAGVLILAGIRRILAQRRKKKPCP